VVIGLIFLVNGYPKLFDKKVIKTTVKEFKSLRVPAPRLFVFLVGVVEFFGGLLILVGLLTPIWAFLIAMIMVVAIALTGAKKGFKGGYEKELLVFAVCMMLFMLGAGGFSLGAVLAI